MIPVLTRSPKTTTHVAQVGGAGLPAPRLVSVERGIWGGIYVGNPFHREKVHKKPKKAPVGSNCGLYGERLDRADQ